MKKILLSALAFMTILSFNACSDAELHQDLNANGEPSANVSKGLPGMEADASYQWEANEKLTKLIESFGTTRNRFNQEVPRYPDHYGGAYITETGTLVVYVYGDMDRGREQLSALLGGGNVEFKEAQFSYAHLTEIMDELNEFAISKKDPEIIEMLSGFSLMDLSNQIEVQVIGLDDRKVSVLKKNSIFDKPAIRFIATEGRVKQEVNIYPGCQVSRNASMAGAGSVGFKVKRNSDSKIGFVTAGHAILVGETAYYSGIAVGTCTNSQQSGTIDAALVIESNPSSNFISNQLCSTTDLLSVATTLPGVGTVINMRGFSTGATSGTVISTNVSVLSSSGSTITNLTSANYTSAGGDSGGPVYTYLSGTGSRPIAGIHLGADGSTRYYTKADNILSTFGLSTN